MMDEQSTLQVRVCLRSQSVWLMPYTTRELEDLLKRMLSTLHQCGYAQKGIELSLVNDGEIADANAVYMHCTGPTNILSFPGGSDLAGNLILSLETMARECLLYGQSPREHMLRLLAHGTAHLAGLEHGKEHQRLQNRLIAAADGRS